MIFSKFTDLTEIETFVQRPTLSWTAAKTNDGGNATYDMLKNLLGRCQFTVKFVRVSWFQPRPSSGRTW